MKIDSLRTNIGLSRPYEPDFPGKRNPWDPNKHPFHYQYIQGIIDTVDSEPNRPPKYSDEVKLEVFRLRDTGLTLRQIAEETGISKSTACLYLQNRDNYKLESNPVVVKQPGTSNVIKTSYRMQEINVGKISPKTKRKKISS